MVGKGGEINGTEKRSEAELAAAFGFWKEGGAESEQRIARIIGRARMEVGVRDLLTLVGWRMWGGLVVFDLVLRAILGGSDGGLGGLP